MGSDPASSPDIVWETTGSGSSDRFEFTAEGGGRIGFMGNSQNPYIDNITVKTDRDNNGSYETTEHVETFDLNGSDQIEEDYDYDAAGNLTFDGVYKYTYDAFNRLVKAEKAYRDSSGTVQTGSTLTTYAYDGQNRRITREVTNNGPLNDYMEVVFSYAGDRIVGEYDDGTSSAPIKTYVWGLTYIDELIETGFAGTQHYALLDTKFSVLGLVDDTGDYVERYEYTPDGRRQVYISAGTNDPDAQTPTSEAPRQILNNNPQPHALCTIGFQGLRHDEVTGNIYQRAREYSPRLGRFLQRDPLGYPDGMNTYAAYHVMYGGLDPTGMATDKEKRKECIREAWREFFDERRAASDKFVDDMQELIEDTNALKRKKNDVRKDYRDEATRLSDQRKQDAQDADSEYKQDLADAKRKRNKRMLYVQGGALALTIVTGGGAAPGVVSTVVIAHSAIIADYTQDLEKGRKKRSNSYNLLQQDFQDGMSEAANIRDKELRRLRR